MPTELLLRQVRPMAGEPVDVHIVDGRIKSTGAAPEVGPEAEIVDGAGRILLPGFVDAHTHLDKTFWGQPWQPNRAGPKLIDKIENERRMLRELNHSAEAQSARQVRQSIRMGTTHIRSHVDVSTAIALRHVEGVLATRAAFADSLTLQLVAFPQSGMLIRPGTVELLDEALRMGVELIGGIDPSSIDRDPVGHLNTVFDLAGRHGAGVDIHLHETGELGAFAVELIAERTRVQGLEGKVTISHAFCLGMVRDAYLDELTRLLLDNDIAIMTHGPGEHPFPPIKRLYQAGVRLCSGSDGIRDSWGPYGNADMLEKAMWLGYRSNFRKDEELEMTLDIATRGGATVMGAEGYGLKPGCRADCVLVHGQTLAHAVVERDPRRLVISNGRIVARDGECRV